MLTGNTGDFVVTAQCSAKRSGLLARWWCGYCLVLSLAGAPLAATAAETVRICYNYGCLAEAQATFAPAQLQAVRLLLAAAGEAADERQHLALAIGQLLAWAGEQTPIHADRGGNYADDGVFGRMDCIDHATTTTGLLRLIEEHGWLRFHRVVEPAWRLRFLVLEHHAAQIEEVAAAHGETRARYVVDSWFRDNGQPALVFPLTSWLAGAGEEDAVAGARGRLAGSATAAQGGPGSW